MKRNLTVLTVAIVLFGLAPLAAQAQQNPVSSAVRMAMGRDGKNLLAGAAEMPASKLNYAPTPEQMTFGHLMMHIAMSNMFLCSKIGGEKAPALGHLTEHSPKATLLSAMKASFGFCDQVLAKVNDSELDQQVDFFGGRKISKAAAMIALTNDMADHYAQEAIYLRLNGHLPPTAMRHHGMPMKKK